MSDDPYTELYVLPLDYDPSSDGARAVVELFLDYRWPPDTVRIEPLSDGRTAAVATWTDPEKAPLPEERNR